MKQRKPFFFSSSSSLFLFPSSLLFFFCSLGFSIIDSRSDKGEIPEGRREKKRAADQRQTMCYVTVIYPSSWSAVRPESVSITSPPLQLRGKEKRPLIGGRSIMPEGEHKKNECMAVGPWHHMYKLACKHVHQVPTCSRSTPPAYEKKKKRRRSFQHQQV